MSPVTRLAVGFVLVTVGIVLALGFPDHEIGWFRGRPFGVVLAVVGVIDVAEALWARRRRPSQVLD